MVTTLLHSALLSALESCVNHVLALDPAAQKKLQPLAGKILRIHCERPDICVNIMVCEDQLLLTSNADFNADASIHGKLASLLKLLAARDTSRLREDGIVIQGDTGLINALQGIFSNMDVDWEFRLSKIIGDIPTQLLSDSLDAGKSFLKQSGRNLRQDVDDYLHEESRLFPSSVQLDRFYRSIDSLRLRVDRLQARTSRLQSRLTP